MSLITDRMVECIRLVESNGTVSDGLGGVAPVRTEGERFAAALALEESGPSRRGDRDAPADRYSVWTARTVSLGFHDVFRRASDGMLFRVVSEGADDRTPASAGLDLRRAFAERWGVDGHE